MISDGDNLLKCQAWKEWAHRLKIEMHQPAAQRPPGNGLAGRSNQSILQRLQRCGVFSNNEWEVDLFFAESQFKNLTSNSLQLSPLEVDEGHTPHFSVGTP